jgi:hypothetical protein
MAHVLCDPVAHGVVSFPISGQVLALGLVGFLLILAVGLGLAADRDSMAIALHEETRGINTAIKEGVRRLAGAWRDTQRRATGQLHFLEATGFLLSAGRLVEEGELFRAENLLEAALRDLREATSFLPDKDSHVARLTREIKQAARDVQTKATTEAAHMEDVVARSKGLLAELEKAA